MWGMITALVSGALMSIQGVFNSAVMKQTSMWVSAGWVQISAFVVCLLLHRGQNRHRRHRQRILPMIAT